MHVERYGEGAQHFLAVHGWSGDHRTFEPLVRDLPAGVSFHAVDLPGCGRSPAPLAWTLDAVTDELAEEIRAVGDKVTLVGNCSGANLLLFAALRTPGRVQRIVTIDAFAYWPWYFRVFLNPHFGRYAYITTFANPFGRWMTNLTLRGKRAGDTSLVEGFEKVDHQTTYRYLELLGAAGNIEQFRDLAMPIDLCYGEKSFADVHRSAERFGELWPQAKITRLTGAGHLPIREAAPQLCQLLFSYLEKDCACSINSTRFVS